MAFRDQTPPCPVEVAQNPAYAEAIKAMPSELVWKPLSEYRREDFDVREGFSSSILVNNRHGGDAESLLALLRLRERIEATPLTADDCTDMGNKHTECSWGLCEETGLFPNPASHTWPMDYLKTGRLAARSREPMDMNGSEGRCPMDRRYTGEDGRTFSGCFYSCRVFSPKGESKPDREEALRLCDVAIEKTRTRIAAATSVKGETAP